LLWPLWGTNYDQVARLWQDGLVEERMAYGEFSYEAEKILVQRGYSEIHPGLQKERRAFERLSKPTTSI